MKKYWSTILIVMLLLTIPLAACDQQGKNTAPPSGITPPADQPSGTYPPPAEVQEAYPEPQGEATAIDWSIAKQYILNGEIWQVIQAASLEVKMYSKDGHLYTSTAPSAEEIGNTIKQCADWCKGMTYTKQ